MLDESINLVGNDIHRIHLVVAKPRQRLLGVCAYTMVRRVSGARSTENRQGKEQRASVRTFALQVVALTLMVEEISQVRQLRVQVM